MKKDLILSSVFSIFLVVVLALTLNVGGRNTDLRKGAAFSGVDVLLLPNNNIQAKVGDKIKVQLQAVVKNNTKVDGIQSMLCYDSALEMVGEPASVIIPDTTAGLESKIITSKVKDVNGRSCVRFALFSTKSSGLLKTGAVKMADITLTAISSGEGKIELVKNETVVSGDNPNNIDKEISIDSVAGTSYKISDLPTTGNDPILNFRIKFGGVFANSKCATDWPLKITVTASNGESKTVSNVVPIIDTTFSDKTTYKGTVKLTGFSQKNNLSVFIKGPKHLQSKFGMDKQATFYNEMNGKINLTADQNSPLYDFSNYALLPGDVVGNSGEKPDGVINGIDFSYIKSKSLTHQMSGDGQSMLADLDGNCQYNSNDVNLLKKSLSEKQEQTY